MAPFKLVTVHQSPLRIHLQYCRYQSGDTGVSATIESPHFLHHGRPCSPAMSWSLRIRSTPTVASHCRRSRASGMCIASSQMARPPRNPDAPAWQAIFTCRANSSKVTPALSRIHGDCETSLSYSQAARITPSSFSQRISTGNSALSTSTPSGVRSRAESATSAGLRAAKSSGYSSAPDMG